MKARLIVIIGSATLLLILFFYIIDDKKGPPALKNGQVDYAESEKYWRTQIDELGPKVAYKKMKTYAEQLDLTDAHNVAHTFGTALYYSQGINGLIVCDSEFLWGCFHQFTAIALTEHGTSIVPDLRARCKNVNEPFRCQHGIGHGLLGYFGYLQTDLEKALEECDRIESGFPGRGCSDGAFMEYNIRELTATSSRPLPRAFTEKGAYEPCVSIREKYRSSCAFELPIWWAASLGIKDLNSLFDTIGSLCRQAPESLQKSCARGLGFSIGANIDDVSAGVAACNKTVLMMYASDCIGSMIRRHFEDPREKVNACREVFSDLNSRDRCEQNINTPVTL